MDETRIVKLVDRKNPNRKSWHIRAILHHGPGVIRTIGEMNKGTIHLRRLAAKLLVIRGVEEFTVLRYHIVITKGRAFDWEELDPDIEEALREFVTESLKEGSEE